MRPVPEGFQQRQGPKIGPRAYTTRIKRREEEEEEEEQERQEEVYIHRYPATQRKRAETCDYVTCILCVGAQGGPDPSIPAAAASPQNSVAYSQGPRITELPIWDLKLPRGSVDHGSPK